MIRFRHDGPAPVTGFSSFLANGLTLAPLGAVIFTLWQNGRALAGFEQTTEEEQLILGAMALSVLICLGLFLVRRRFRQRARITDPDTVHDDATGRVLTFAMTALLWLLLVLLPSTSLKAVVSRELVGAGGLAWAGQVLFTTMNPRLVAALLHPRRAGHWVQAPAYDYDRHDHATGSRGIRLNTRPVPAIVFAAIFFLGVFSVHYPSWLPSLEHDRFVSAHLAAVTVGGAILGALLGLAGSGGGESVLGRLGRKLVAGQLFAGVGLALAPATARVGLPYAASWLMPTRPETALVTVVALGERVPRGSCRYALHVARADDPQLTNWLCEVPSNLWDRLKPGDRLAVSGPATDFGIRYDQIAPAG